MVPRKVPQYVVSALIEVSPNIVKSFKMNSKRRQIKGDKQNYNDNTDHDW